MAVSYDIRQIEQQQLANKTLSDNIANIAKFDSAISDLPCENILGLVIYDLPGRDCAAKASNGELKYNELSRYKSEYVDRMLKPLPTQ